MRKIYIEDLYYTGDAVFDDTTLTIRTNSNYIPLNHVFNIEGKNYQLVEAVRSPYINEVLNIKVKEYLK